MTDKLSTTIKSGNVLALLNTLYTSGFAMTSPNQPMLKGRTMHTLYALSFIVYSSNCFFDWIHVYCTLKGAVTSFPLETWVVIVMVTVVVAGSMLNGLLLVLCVENAFAHRLDVTPYRSGFAIIVEAIVEWVQAFNNFRVVFLVMVLHDTPMTIINYFFIASCRCAGPDVFPWSLLISSFSSTISLLWRLVMLYFGYRRMLCPLKQSQMTPGVARFPTPLEHLKDATTTSDGGRLNELDECWPVRWSRKKIYGMDFPVDDDETRQEKKREMELNYCLPLVDRIPLCQTRIAKKILILFGKTIRFFVLLVKGCVCGLIAAVLYVLFGLLLCIPCCYHYTCRKNSFYHRHKCSRSFVRYMSYTYHYTIFGYSLVSTLALISLNTILMTSVHVVGTNVIPPEISRVCISLDKPSRTIRASIGPEPLFGDQNNSIVCKPIWEDGGLGFGLHRHTAGPWQTRITIESNKILAVSTRVLLSYADKQHPSLTLLHDHAILEISGNKDLRLCKRGTATKWRFLLDDAELPWPYFRACERNWFYEEEKLIDCEDHLKTTTTTLKPTTSTTARPIRPKSRKQYRPLAAYARKHRHEKMAKSHNTKF